MAVAAAVSCDIGDGCGSCPRLRRCCDLFIEIDVHHNGVLLQCSSHEKGCRPNINCEIKERIKNTKDDKKAKMAELVSKSKGQAKGNVPKNAASKAPKLGGGGGKR